MSESKERMLALKALEMTNGRTEEIERCCWMVVHESKHNTLPVEYDIRDIDEGLYLKVLSIAKSIEFTND
tara:strand:+ start:25 stop:234 length:210 start_codon:yes stop_codon:yes gene_type:complete